MACLRWNSSSSFGILAGDSVRLRLRESDLLHAAATLEHTRVRYRDSLQVIEDALPAEAMLLGEFSVADISVHYGIMLAKLLGEFPEGFPRCDAYDATLRQRPAYMAAMAT